MHATRPAHLILLNAITLIIIGEVYSYEALMLSCLACCYFSLICPDILLGTLFSHTHIGFAYFNLLGF